ncbi:hypothetical protein GIB67_015589 [Kingdonia uniflora]|uniref:Uncharacterized protein n=1 Tax=Kingdonia uniflora TaxID=39325 RepID=A0A7J7LU03_9MAGN|nr:hypothetical protein GIB67_015589 [Kingdonia uniflora]
MVDKEARLLLVSSSQRTRISFEDCDVNHVNFPHHDALVIMLKMRNVIPHIMMVDTGSRIELLFQNIINQMGLADKVEPSDIDVSSFNGSKEERNMRAIPSTYYLALRFNWNGGLYEIKGSQKLACTCENTVTIVTEPLTLRESMHLYVDTARGIGSSQLLEEEADYIVRHDQQEFLAITDYLSNYGLTTLILYIQAVATKVLNGKQLRDPFNSTTLGETIMQILDIFMGIHHWATYLVPENVVSYKQLKPTSSNNFETLP